MFVLRMFDSKLQLSEMIMTPEEKWHKINNFSFPQSFYKLLSKKENWKMDFTIEAVAEYKKFMYLATYSAVTPSIAIDEVWHLHIQHTSIYEEFCHGIFDQDFGHHNPELIKPENGISSYYNQYYDTLERYYWEFGCHPPRNVWFYELEQGTQVKSGGRVSPLSTESWWRTISHWLSPALWGVIIPAKRKKYIPSSPSISNTLTVDQEQILNWQFPEGFTSRLMKEEGWSEQFAKQAIHNY